MKGGMLGKLGPLGGGGMSSSPSEPLEEEETDAADEGADDSDEAEAGLGDELVSAIKSGDGAAVYRAFEGLMAACQMKGS